MPGKLSAVLLLLCLTGPGLSIKCWQSGPSNATDNMVLYNVMAGGIIQERTCTAKRCVGYLYQVGQLWFHQNGCTDEPVIMQEEKRGKGMYYKKVCETDWCNNCSSIYPSIFMIVMASVVKQFVN